MLYLIKVAISLESLLLWRIFTFSTSFSTSGSSVIIKKQAFSTIMVVLDDHQQQPMFDRFWHLNQSYICVCSNVPASPANACCNILCVSAALFPKNYRVIGCLYQPSLIKSQRVHLARSQFAIRKIPMHEALLNNLPAPQWNGESVTLFGARLKYTSVGSSVVGTYLVR